MNNRAKLATLFAAGSLFLVGVGSQAMANSAMTDMFVANVRPNVDFLDRSSRMALDKTTNPNLRAFAHREAVEQTIAANSLVAWTQANTLSGAAVATGAAAVVPVAPVVVAPVQAAVAAPGELLTGRSVAEELTVTRAPRETVQPGTGGTLDQLATLQGRAFDTMYKSTQVGSLRQLAALYTDYIQRGDDDGLRAMAIREMPKINRRLAELRAL